MAKTRRTTMVKANRVEELASYIGIAPSDPLKAAPWPTWKEVEDQIKAGEMDEDEKLPEKIEIMDKSVKPDIALDILTEESKKFVEESVEHQEANDELVAASAEK